MSCSTASKNGLRARIAMWVLLVGLIAAALASCAQYAPATGEPTTDAALSAAATPSALRARATTSFVTDPQTATAPEKPARTLPPDKRLKKAAEINGEVVGWIMIPGTSVDFPVTQCGDNEYYLTHNALNKEDRRGAIFMDRRCDAQELLGNVILYGHHMRDGTMFAPLVNYRNKEFYKNHKFIEYSTASGKTRWEIFSAYDTTPDFNYIRTSFGSTDEYFTLIWEMQGKSLIKTNVVLSPTDDILTLSTCDYDYKDERFVVNARRIK